MKSNDEIPADEMLLAEAHGAAMARGLGWVSMKPFAKFGRICRPSMATDVCALGAIHLAGRTPLSTALNEESRRMVAGMYSGQVWSGNDTPGRWSYALDDCGESLGWAFRCAMTQDESDPETEALLRERGAL